MKNQITAEELRQKMADYLANTSDEQLRKDLDESKYLQNVPSPFDPNNLKKLYKAADEARVRVSGYSRRKRTELLRKAKLLMQSTNTEK